MPDFAAFEVEARAAGFDEVLEKHWDPGQSLDTHTHAFGVRLRVVRGDLSLRCGGETTALRAGDEFSLAAGLPHAERYGPEGATLWIARRHEPTG
jgi:quercetin dioxygenase-like cupin family protein